MRRLVDAMKRELQDQENEKVVLFGGVNDLSNHGRAYGEEEGWDRVWQIIGWVEDGVKYAVESGVKEIGVAVPGPRWDGEEGWRRVLEDELIEVQGRWKEMRFVGV